MKLIEHRRIAQSYQAQIAELESKHKAAQARIAVLDSRLTEAYDTIARLDAQKREDAVAYRMAVQELVNEMDTYKPRQFAAECRCGNMVTGEV